MVRVEKENPRRESRPLTLLHESLVYDVSDRGLQLSADLRLDVLGEPIRRVALLLEEPLQLVKVYDGAKLVPWSEEFSAESAEKSKQSPASKTIPAPPGFRRVVLELPEPLAGTGPRVVPRSGCAPLPHSTAISRCFGPMPWYFGG